MSEQQSAAAVPPKGLLLLREKFRTSWNGRTLAECDRNEELIKFGKTRFTTGKEKEERLFILSFIWDGTDGRGGRTERTCGTDVDARGRMGRTWTGTYQTDGTDGMDGTGRT